MQRASEKTEASDSWIFIPAFPKQHLHSRAPLPIPVSTRGQGRSIHAGNPLSFGGLQVPPPKSRPRSIGPKPQLFPVQQLDFLHADVHGTTDLPVSTAVTSVGRGRSLTSASSMGISSSTLLRFPCPSKSTWLVNEWSAILKALGSLSSVAQALTQSSYPQDHAARLLDQFAPSTLLRYFSAWQSFAGTVRSLGLSLDSLTEGQLADVLIAISLGKKSDCCAGTHISIKAVRWMATHAGVSCLKIAWAPLIESFLRSRIPKELKESIPFSLYTLVQLERRLLMSSCSLLEIVLIGSVLICTWGGLRFADAQRCSFSSFCFDGRSLRASCWRTKTSHRGQPWGVSAAGFLSLGEYTWLHKWLQTMDELWTSARTTDLDMAVPDFIFPKLSPEGIQIPWSPMSYADALAGIRKVTALPWKTAPQKSSHWTAHSMKSTLLSWGSQLMAEGLVQPEERLLQGHHRQSTSRSLRVYSRDDVHGQLSFQRKVIDHVRRGGRFPTPPHRGAQHPLTEPAVQVEFFRKAAKPYEWKSFKFGDPDMAVPAPAGEPEVLSDSSSSSSDSSSTSSSNAAGDTGMVKPPNKKARLSLLPDVPDELFLAHTTRVQRAMIASDKDWHPYLEGRHFQASCGARMDPDRTVFSR